MQSRHMELLQLETNALEDASYGYVIEGSLVFHEEGKEDVTLSTGDSYIVSPNVSHGIDCLTDVKLLDIFTPMREDFI